MISRRQTVLLYCCYTTTTSPRLRVEIARRSALGTRPFNGSKFASYATASSSRSELSRVCQAWAARNQYIPLSLPAGWWYTVIARCCSAQAQGETGLPGEDRTRVRRGPLARSLARTDTVRNRMSPTVYGCCLPCLETWQVLPPPVRYPMAGISPGGGRWVGVCYIDQCLNVGSCWLWSVRRGGQATSTTMDLTTDRYPVVVCH